ncbi:hypothetical protein KAR91_05440, partial [Candidatus Pacearchaeota archaeon]|nr:hypothetical protein [Candidatus Pacearchaeota archaeon]
IDNTEIRKILLTKIGFIQPDKDLIKRLDKLTIFNSENLLNMEQFHFELNEIISWREINSIPKVIHEIPLNESTLKILNAISWSLQSWLKGVSEADINKVVISYLIAERLYLMPEVDLPWRQSFEQLKTRLSEIIPKITLDANLDLPKQTSYSDAKYYSNYKNSVEDKNYKDIFIFLNAFKLGGGFNYSNDDFIRSISKISLAIDEKLISNNISEFSPLLINNIIGHMNNNQIMATLERYEDKSPLPLLIGVIQIVNPIGNNTFQGDLLTDYKFIAEAAKIVGKISKRIETNALYSYITKCSNIFMNELWHSIYSAFLAGNPNHFDDYLNKINFSHNTGEHSYDTFIQCGNDSNLDKFAVKIYFKFIENLSTTNHQQHLFFFTSYYKYIFRAVTLLSNKSFPEYLEKLERVSIELLREIHSWDLKNLHMHFTKWIYWILASKEMKHDSEINKSALKHTYKLLLDYKVMNALGANIEGMEISFEKLVDFLDNPKSIKDIILPGNNSTIKMEWTD